MRPFFGDIRYTLRQLRKSPAFTITAVLTLALGIGATTAIFTLVHALLLSSLPVTKPGELWRLGSHNECCRDDRYMQEDENHRPDFSLFSYPLYEYLRDHAPQFSNLAAFEAGQETFTVRRQGSDAPPESAPGVFVSGNAFSTFGVSASLGRSLTPSDDHRSAPPVAMMSYRDWQQGYGSDRSVVGSTLLVNGTPLTIVGITPPGFYGAQIGDVTPDYYLPLADEPLIKGRAAVLDQPTPHWLNLIGRIAPGGNVHAAEAQVNLALQQWLRSHNTDMSPNDREHLSQQRTTLTPGGSGITSMQKEYAGALHILMGAALFVLLIACANIANLMLARGLARRQQTAVRMTLGATRRRLVGQALMESVALALIGGAAGLLVAYGGTRAILHLAFAQAKGLPIHASPSWPVLLFAFAASLATGVLFGIAPAFLTSHTNPIEAIRGANRSSQGRAALPQKLLIVVQAAFSLVLISAAILLTRSLDHLQSQHYGFQPAARVSVQIDRDTSFIRPDQYAVFYRELVARMKSIPGVQGVSYAMYSPMSDNNWNDLTYVEGRTPSPKPLENASSYNRIGPDYFDVVGTRILHGRGITQDDIANGRPVAVVNESFARQFFGDKDPLGHHVGRNELNHAGDYEIVGVSEDTRYSTYDLHDPIQSMWFMPLSHWAQYDKPSDRKSEDRGHFAGAIVLRTSVPISVLEPQVKRALAEVDPNVAVDSIETMPQLVRDQFTQESLVTRLTSLFGALALALAAIGLCGVTGYTVERRTAEIGIRMALGANRAAVLRMVLSNALVQVGLGIAIGVPVALLVANAMRSHLYGVAPYNPLILGFTALVLLAVAAMAALLPAQRAARIEPVTALRAE